MNGIQQGIELIKKWEKCRLKAFIPVPGDPWTIGWGATGPNIYEGLVWTQDEADADLQNRVNIIVSQIRTAVKVPMTDGQLAAFIDFCYNEGIHAFQMSTLLKLFNDGDVTGAYDEFPKWDVAHGQVLQGLLNRREDEQRAYSS